MSTPARTAANRRNALKSTGPRTASGKAIVALNPVRHGLLAKEVLLPTEDAAQLGLLAEAMQTQLQPVGAVEALLVDIVVASTWRLRRLLAVEDYLFQHRYAGDRERHPPGECFAGDSGDTFTKLMRYESAIERRLYQALHELEQLQDARQPAPGTVSSLARMMLGAMEAAEATEAAEGTASAAD